MQRQRKHSEDGHSESEEQAEFFPRRNAGNLKQAIELLTHHYNPKQHSVQLANCCYRCHLKHVSQAYNQFRIKAQIQLQEPRISNFYENSQFVDLKKLVRSSNDGSVLLPDPCILPVPKSLGYLLDELFEVYGYVPNLERFLLYFPTYLQMHRAVEKDLFEKGKVDSKSAYFVGLYSAAELGSVYIMARMLRNYLKSGGPTEWFAEDRLPQRLKCLKNLSRLMARTPWLITPDTIEDILQNNGCHWTRNELAQYVQIIAFSHQMSTIALSVGLLPEQNCLLKYFNMQQILNLKQSYDLKSYESAVQNRQKLAVMIPVLKELEQQSEKALQCKQEISSKKELKRSMKKIEVTDIYMKEINNELTKQSLYKEVNLCVAPLLAPFQIIEKRGETSKYHNVVDYSEYNYKFKAYPLLNNLTHETADKIEAMISYSEIMTRGNFGNEKVNHTKEFRKAVRYYAQNLCGFTHHEYDFKWKVAEHLTMALKFYIRLVTMSPLHISRQVVRETNHESGQIECFDLGHLAVLIANTKMSLQLMFVVQAFDL